MNSVQLIGGLAADPELRTTNTAGIPVANFRVAICVFWPDLATGSSKDWPPFLKKSGHAESA